MPPAIPYRHDIDGLRAIAVLAVILNHAGFKAVGGGFVGVDVFFVISGFLITGIVLKDLKSGRFSLKSFYERRACRILPALTVMILAITPFAAIWMPPWELAAYGKSIVAAALSISNITFWQEAGYFAAASQTKPLLHTWSLGVEEQFYVLLPLALMPLVRRDRLLLALVIAAAALSLGLSEILGRWRPEANFYLLPTRAWELLAGVLCALIAARAPPRPNDLLAGAGLALVIGAIFAFDEATPAPSLYMLAPVGGTALVLMYTRPGGAVATALSWRPIALVGLISYSAYLWHQPIFALARIRLGAPPSDAVMAALCAATLALGWLSWRFVERPFRRPAPSRPDAALPDARPHAALRASAAAIAAVALVGAVLWNSGGLLTLKADPMQRAYLRSAAPSPLRAACHTGGAAYLPPARACTLPEGAATWAVLGDSHAVELAYALAQASQGRAVRQLSFSGCAPSWHAGGANPCARWTDQAVRNLIDDARIEVVVVSYRLTQHLAQRPEQVWRAYVDMIAALRAAGKDVAVVLQAPELPAPMRDLAMQGGGAQIQGLARVQWEARRSYVTARMRDLPLDALIIDPAALFCDPTGCLAGRGGVSNYFDDNHMSVAGAARVAQLLIDWGIARTPGGAGTSAGARHDPEAPRSNRRAPSAL